MAISQGFNLPPTGRIGRTTTGHRSGNYNMRVIPDVDSNAERSDKQKVESSKFGFLSDMLNKNLEFLKIGFPKAYQPLNYAIKKNISLVSNTENGFEFDFPKAVFSEGKLAQCSPISVRYVSPAASPRTIRFNFMNDIPTKKSPLDNILAVIYYPHLKLLHFYTTTTTRGSDTLNQKTVNFSNIELAAQNSFFASLFFYNEKEKIVSNTIYFGYVQR